MAGLAAALVLGGCLNQGDSKKVDDAAAQLFAQLKAKQYDAIYDAAAPELQKTTARGPFDTFLQQVDASYGACQTPVKAPDYHFNADSNGYFATQGYTVQCANGPMKLQVTIVLRQGVAKIAGINVSPGGGGGDTNAAANTVDNAASNGT